MKRLQFITALTGALTLPFVSVSKPSVKIKPKVDTKRITFNQEMLTRHNFGLFIIRADVNVYDNADYAATVSWKLGYQMIPKRYGFGKYGRINFLTDGWFCDMANDKKQLCSVLNMDDDGFRLLTKGEVIYMLENRNQGFLKEEA